MEAAQRVLESVGGAYEGLEPQGGVPPGEAAGGGWGRLLRTSSLASSCSSGHFHELFSKFMGTRQLAFAFLFKGWFVKFDVKFTHFS